MRDCARTHWLLYYQLQINDSATIIFRLYFPAQCRGGTSYWYQANLASNGTRHRQVERGVIYNALSMMDQLQMKIRKAPCVARNDLGRRRRRWASPIHGLWGKNVGVKFYVCLLEAHSHNPKICELNSDILILLSNRSSRSFHHYHYAWECGVWSVECGVQRLDFRSQILRLSRSCRRFFTGTRDPDFCGKDESEYCRAAHFTVNFYRTFLMRSNSMSMRWVTESCCSQW